MLYTHPKYVSTQVDRLKKVDQKATMERLKEQLLDTRRLLHIKPCFPRIRGAFSVGAATVNSVAETSKLPRHISP